MISYDEMLQRYGVDLNISKIYFNPTRVDFKGSKSSSGQYIACDIIIKDTRFGQLRKESVIVPLSMLHSLANSQTISNTIFKEMVRQNEINDSEINEFLDYYDKYDKIIDSVFNQNNIYGISINEFNKMISDRKLSNQITDKSKILPAYFFTSDIVFSFNIIRHSLTQYYLKIHDYFVEPDVILLDIKDSELNYYNLAKEYIDKINKDNNSSAFYDLENLILDHDINLYKDLGNYRLIDLIESDNIKDELTISDDDLMI
jgi:hypothetical protein